MRPCQKKSELTPVPVCLAFSSSDKEIGCHEIIVSFRRTTTKGHGGQEIT